jgi:plastocyanin
MHHAMTSSQRVWLCAVLATLIVPGPSRAGDLFGVVSRKALTPQPPPVAKRYRSSGVEQVALQKVEHCNCNPSLYSVVSLQSGRAAGRRPGDVRPQMAQENKRFVPTVLAVQVGDTVTFPNFDPFFHNVFSYSRVKRFDLGRYPEGQSAEVVFDQPGVAQVFCEIHASMRAYIHVLETPYFTVSDEQGRFRITGVPEGDYQLRVWQEGQPDLAQPISISGDSLFVDVMP